MDKKSAARLALLDELRGFSVLLMVFYHSFFLLYASFDVELCRKLFYFFMPAEPFFAGTFIFISGISCRLSRNNLKRGLRLLAVSVALTLVTAVILPRFGFVECEIYFGILHFLSVAMLLFALCRKLLDRVKPHWGILLCTVLYVFTSGISNGTLSFANLITVDLPASLYEYNFLFPFGIYSQSFRSADYFAVFPHIFLFLAGSYAGVYAKQGLFPSWAYPCKCRPLAFMGRHSLIIYLAHQPAVFAVAAAVEGIIGILK